MTASRVSLLRTDRHTMTDMANRRLTSTLMLLTTVITGLNLYLLTCVITGLLWHTRSVTRPPWAPS